MSGHTIDECFKKSKRTFTNEKVCFICHKKGHIARVCNEKRVNQINWNTNSCIEEKESGSIPDNMTFLSNTSSEKEYQPVINTISFTQQHKAHKKQTKQRKERKVRFLGHVITEDGIHTDPEKTNKVKNWKKPETMKELSFMGFASYYRKFIKNFSFISAPLEEILSREKARGTCKSYGATRWSLVFTISNLPYVQLHFYPSHQRMINLFWTLMHQSLELEPFCLKKAKIT